MPELPGLVWDARSGRYRRPNGRYVSRLAVRDALDAAVGAAGARMERLARQLVAREISVAEWQTAMRLALRDVHAYSAAVARGGLAQMTPAEWGHVGAALRDQYARLRALAAGLADGSIPADGRFLVRARLYGRSGKVTYEGAARREQEARGFDEERNLRGKLDSCAGCLDATAAGWVPSGTLSPPGARDCLGNCGCRLERRNSRTGQLAA